MTVRDDISQMIREELDRMSGATCLSPTSLALAVQLKFDRGDIEAHIKYTSLEHLKQMSREILRGQFDPVASSADEVQEDMFSGHLQNRYPVKVANGQDPQYKLRIELSYDEAKWNVSRMRKAAQGLLDHCTALDAWNESRGGSDTAAA